MNIQKFDFFLFLMLMLLVGWGCTSEGGNEQQKAKPTTVEQLDPYSAPLYAAQNEAEAKNFSVKLVGGEQFQLAEKQGQVVLLNIWATWCAPCREETPELVDLYEKYKEKGFVILGVSIDEQGMSVVKPFIEEYEVNYPMVIDDGTIMDKYGPTMGVPTTYIIDKRGNLRYFAVGAVTSKELEPRIKALLDEDVGSKS
ncbi:TlpA disulfide reductase family protein [Fodinibius salsisoli]|uniref:TlpA family protein disulfide reductase n=1 Tax=Fodinibius salsisoli TaxID=2820877 RepID=A0ABT3PHP3_9BACT|nr:TlpA disulfide reductase family protein [Fodinibius salsisoli]MCW9705432.1 TlpA family protein disulfide reductase [Fodinibius salsisoli]